jgi:hypothetical protein
MLDPHRTQVVAYFERFSNRLRVIPMDPRAFVAQLYSKWRERHPEPVFKPPTVPQAADPSVCPPGAVFISYASDDRPVAEAIAQQIAATGCPVWFDRDQLMLGADWENELRRGVMETAGVFLSLISKNTEKKIDAYYIWERNWASRRADRLAESAVFYLPVRIDEGNLIPDNEPIGAKGIQAISISGGVLPSSVLQRICQLVCKYCEAQGHPVPQRKCNL